MFAHQRRRMRRECWTDRGDADRHYQNQTGFKDFGIWLAAHHATEPIDNVNNANAGHRELKRPEKRGEFYQPNRAQIEKSANCENKLRAPDIFKAIRRRREDAQSVIAPGKSEIECNCDNGHHCGVEIVRTGPSSRENSCVIPSIAKFKRNRTFTLPVSHLTFCINGTRDEVPIRIVRKTGGLCPLTAQHPAQSKADATYDNCAHKRCDFAWRSAGAD